MVKKVLCVLLIAGFLRAENADISSNEHIKHGPKAVKNGIIAALSCAALYASINKFREDVVPLTCGTSKIIWRRHEDATKDALLSGMIVACVAYTSYRFIRSCLSSAVIFLKDDDEPQESSDTKIE